MTKILTFIDASVLIYAAKKPTAETFARRFRALKLISDPDREFISTEFLKMEVLPIPVYFKKQREIRFHEIFFDSVSIWADSASLIEPAYEIGCRYGLAAMDALHIAAAQQHEAEFISAEKPTKPIYRTYKNISSIY